MKYSIDSSPIKPSEAITQLCFLKTCEDIINSTKFDACIVCGSNEPEMMDKVYELYVKGNLRKHITISGHQAPTSLSPKEIEQYEILLDSYNQLKNLAESLGICEQDIEPPFVKKLRNSKNTLQLRKFQEPEYAVFKAHAINLGIPEEIILTEEHSTNAKENIHFSMELLEEKVGLKHIQKILIVCKSFMTRRVEMVLKAMPELPNHLEFYYLPYASSNKPHAIRSEDWHEDPIATKRVLEEIVRIGNYAIKGDLGL